jgi:hypothetical protein
MTRAIWSSVEKFIEEFSDIEFTHGVCDTCIRKHFPEVADVLLEGKDANKNSERESKQQDELLG